MPDDDQDLAFTFDTKFFKKGVKDILGGFDLIENKASVISKGVSKGITNMTVKLGAVFAGFKSIKTMIMGIPEISQVFSISKDIFLKNFLFPLRKEILPLLQKVLDWVRTSRVRFVKWGQSLANIFRAVVSGVKGVISFVKKMSSGIGEFLGNIFGSQIKDVEQLFSLVAFKLATVIQFISVLGGDIGNVLSDLVNNMGDISVPLSDIVSNVATLVGKVAKFAVDMSGSFLEGFIPSIKDVLTPLAKISDSFNDIFDNIFGSTTSLEGWSNLFETIGRVVGNTLVKSFEFIAEVLEGIDKILTSIKEEGAGTTVSGSFSRVGEDIANRLFGKKKKVDDAIITPKGDVIETNPKDTLVALKDKTSSLGGLFNAKDMFKGVFDKKQKTEIKIFNPKDKMPKPKDEISRPSDKISTLESKLFALGESIDKKDTSAKKEFQKNVDVNIDFTGMQIILQEGGVKEGQEFAEGLVSEMRDELNSEIERLGL